MLGRDAARAEKFATQTTQKKSMKCKLAHESGVNISEAAHITWQTQQNRVPTRAFDLFMNAGVVIIDYDFSLSDPSPSLLILREPDPVCFGTLVFAPKCKYLTCPDRMLWLYCPRGVGMQILRACCTFSGCAFACQMTFAASIPGTVMPRAESRLPVRVEKCQFATGQ